MQGLQKQALDIKVKKTQELKKQIDGLYEDIVVKTEKAILPSVIFEEYFLDFFKSGEHMNATAPLALKWLELAGGPYNEVTIVDNNGNKIFDTPGLYAKPEVDKKLSDLDFSSIAGTFNLKSNRIHADGINYLNNELNGTENNIHTEVTNYLNRWGIIFKYYSKEVKSKPIAKKILDNTADYLDFD